VLRHAGDERWPFAFASRQVFRLSASALDLELSVTNTGGEPAPAGLGWHPFFIKRPGARVQVRTQGRWEMGPDKLPTVRIPHSGPAGSTDALDVDHCFDGWDGLGLLDDDVLQARVTSGLQRIVVFTTPARDVIAIEPVSHANNVYGANPPGPAAALGAVELAPGETLQAAMRIEVRKRS
jgi:aldose 1-epimerase